MAGDKFISEMYLRQPRFISDSYGLCTNNKKRIQRFKEMGDLRYIYWNKLDKVCSQHDMNYCDFKDLPQKAVLRDKAFNIAENPEYDRYQQGLAWMVYKFFEKKSAGANTCGGAIKGKIMLNQNSASRLADELHKPNIGNFIK